MVRPQITWKFQNICSDDDYYVNPAQSCWGIILYVGQEKERQLVRSLARDKSGYRNWSIFLIFLPVSLKQQRIVPDVEKTALADMYKSLFYKQQLLLNNKIAKT